ncbi:hypothetical protein IQ265_00910 [Nodosilinea sp. LEGE 06152]|uniref:hypothetical protein n=1 Tax=Nodosilinea sp. LEGE 06152 TaxID=2777966 RepID=UPI00187F97E7|nr:hypothetical protein [Nodosilinea sp. LEGE 06152]MBE9155408.1 hypothetical protein [Nodosilinea sp. LEGE 06152]
MTKLFSKLWAAVALGAALGVIIFNLFRVSPALSTVAEAPRLVPAILNGNPISVLYVTRSSDTVLVRCYPGFEPSIAVRPMGGNSPQGEGVLTCVNSEPDRP